MKIKTLVFGWLFVVAFSAPTFAQSLTSTFAGSYSVTDLVSPSGVPIGIGGMAINPSDPNTLFLVGGADTIGAEIYTIELARNAGGQITGFVGTATPYTIAPYADTGLVFAPNGTLLYNEYPFSSMGEILHGGSSPATVVSLPGGGEGGGLGFIPNGFAHAGQLLALGYGTGQAYNDILTPIGGGLYSVSGSLANDVSLNAPAGFGYVSAGSPVFSGPTMLVTDYKGTPGVFAYSVDNNGNPDGPATPFFTGTNLPRGGLVDPLTNDFLFASYDNAQNNIYVVSGFAGSSVPELSSLILFALGLMGAFAATRLKTKPAIG
jgi:hypothetical protein